MLLKGTCIRGATYAHPDQIIGGIAAPHEGNPLSGPATYSAGFHTAPASQIFSAHAQISSETTIQKHYDFERHLDSGATYARSDQINGGFASPQAENPLSDSSHL